MASLQAPIELFKSQRLIYRAPEDSEEDKEFMQNLLINDSTIQTMSTMRMKRPQPKKAVEEFIKLFHEAFLGVFICLPVPTPSENGGKTASEGQSPNATTKNPKPTPIGHVSIFNVHGADTIHHRNVMLGISLAEGHRGKGYGSEAINWGLDWAFMHAGIHRMSICAFSFNVNAVKLYRKLGFVDEGREREAVLYQREWHDVVNLSMLEHEWEALRGIGSHKTDKSPAETVNQG
jgi:ribosomal protein S18 acetylase RimI-like enzyme